jgi:hypothetical protein
MVDFNTHYSPFEAVRTEVWCHRRNCLLTSPETGVAVKSQAKRCFGRTLGRKIRILLGGKATRPLVRRRGRAQKSCGMHGRSRNGETPKEKGSDRSKDLSRSPEGRSTPSRRCAHRWRSEESRRAIRAGKGGVGSFQGFIT